MITITDHFPMDRWESMRGFISENYRPDHQLCSKRYFEWFFRTKQTHGNAPIMCAWEEENIIAIIGYLAVTLHWGNCQRELPGIGLTHWMSRKDAPRGVGWVLARKVVSRFDLAMALNASQQGAPFFKAMGWRFYDMIPRYLWVFDKGICSEMMTDEGLGILDGLLYHPASSPKFQHSTDFSTYAPKWHLYPQMLFGIRRSMEYLQWRYLEHPVFSYHVAMAGDGQRPAVCVYRLERAYGLCNALVGRIVEFFHPDDRQGRFDGSMLMQIVLSQLFTAGCAFAEFFCTNEAFGRSVLPLGGGVEPPGRYILPSRLSPIQQIRHDLNLAFALPGKLPAPTTQNLYFTMSDIDGDQPVRLTQE